MNFSIFGDPSRPTSAPFSTLDIDNTTAPTARWTTARATSRCATTARSSKTWSLNISVSQGTNHFDESDFDRHQPDHRPHAAGARQLHRRRPRLLRADGGQDLARHASTPRSSSPRGQPHASRSATSTSAASTAGIRDRSGPQYTVPATNADGTTVTLGVGGGPAAERGLLAPPGAARRCTLCPLVTRDGVLVPVFLRQDRGEFGEARVRDVLELPRLLRAGHLAAWQEAHPAPRHARRAGAARSATRVRDRRPHGLQLHRPVVAARGRHLRPHGRGQDEVLLQLRPLPRVHPARHGRALALGRAGLPAAAASRPTSPSTPQGRRIATINQYGTVNPVIDAAHLINGGARGRPGRRDHRRVQDPHNPILPGTKLGLHRRAPRRVRAAAARQLRALGPLPQPPAQADRRGRGGRAAGGRLLLRHDLLHRQRQLAARRGRQPARVHLQPRRSASRRMRSRLDAGT